MEKLGTWGLKIPHKGLYAIKHTFIHKIRLSIGLTGSMIKNGKEYWFYGIIKEKYSKFDKIHNKFLKKITPLLNKIL